MQGDTQAHRVDLTGGRVLLLCYPRLLGYAFNPLSVYFCHRADGELALIDYEVRNAFVAEGCATPAGPATRYPPCLILPCASQNRG